jgi:hypothetical protein
MRIAVAIASILAAFIAGVLIGDATAEDCGLIIPDEVHEARLLSNSELLGQVKTVVDEDDPLARELLADDKAKGRS